MAWFRKKKTFAVTYRVDGICVVIRTFVVKAADIAEAAQKCRKREVFPISILKWEVLDDGNTNNY